MKKTIVAALLSLSVIATAHAADPSHLVNDVQGIHFSFDSATLVAKGNETWRCHFSEAEQGKHRYPGSFGKKGDDYPYRCDKNFVVDVVVYKDTGQIQLSGYAYNQNTFNFTTEISQWDEVAGSVN